MASQRWLNEGGIFYPIVGEIVLHDTPGPGVWQVYQSPNINDPNDPPNTIIIIK